MSAASADALNQELAQLVGERRELRGRQPPKIHRQVDGFEERIGVGWNDHLGQFIPPGPLRVWDVRAFVAQSPLGCGNAVGPAIVVYGLPAASSTEQLGRLGRLHHTGVPGAMTLTFRDTAVMDSGITDEGYQERILPHVSRTFALTIPQLPPRLRIAVTNAYLLCRIADTIEDEPALSPAETLAFLDRFKAVVAGPGGQREAVQLAGEVERRLSARTLPAERELIANMVRVLEVTASLTAPQRSAIQRCLELMCYGMPRFQRAASLRGLPRSTDLDDYCYYVAGVVGDMLTELFCEYAAAIDRNRAKMQYLAVSFAQGLQMTNILKDVWEDRSRGACWLPQEVFTPHDVDLGRLAPEPPNPGFDAGMRELIGVAHAHLRNALDYTLLIPAAEAGIRRFCLWAIGLAVL